MARTLLGKLKRGLFMTHTEFLEKAGETLRREGPVAPANLDRLEEALIASDAGVELSLRLVDALREEIRAGRITTAGELRPAIREQLLILLREAEDAQPAAGAREKPRVTLLVGVNGTGKTTTAAKLAKRRQEAGSSVILAAADTFRAAAVDQLKIWAERVGTPVVHQQEGADPAAVVFDAIASARSKKTDEVIVDTAGRLHTRNNLMKELEKVKKVAAREVPGAPHEVVLTKLDGTAKGGVILAIADSLKLPVRWVGVGEDVDDLLPFEAEDFVDSLLEIESGDAPEDSV